jgi:hypothetical protein
MRISFREFRAGKQGGLRPQAQGTPLLPTLLVLWPMHAIGRVAY